VLGVKERILRYDVQQLESAPAAGRCKSGMPGESKHNHSIIALEKGRPRIIRCLRPSEQSYHLREPVGLALAARQQTVYSRR
jgi:hypothetical protein